MIKHVHHSFIDTELVPKLLKAHINKISLTCRNEYRIKHKMKLVSFINLSSTMISKADEGNRERAINTLLSQARDFSYSGAWSQLV